MGFYGNLTNAAEREFAVDRIYSSRTQMEGRILKDGVYLGRYVLVEYDLEGKEITDTYIKVYKDSEGKFYTSNNFELATRIIWSETETSGISVTTEDIVYIGDKKTGIEFYRCVGADKDGFAIFETFDNNYEKNFLLDKEKYGRGYDSTVWQKVYVNDTEKYIMIAELNTRMPTFELVEDAPTMVPITPHFGTDSTDENYKLHWQPQWGLRVAEVENGYKSDEKVTHITSTWDSENNIITHSSKEVDGAIYFNKAAFYPQVNQGTIVKRDDTTEDFISISPTGKSGHKYNDHSNSDGTDIYEMRINLPSLGNTLSDLHDIIHGEERDDKDGLLGTLKLFNNGDTHFIPFINAGGYLTGSKINGGVNEVLEKSILAKDDNGNWVYPIKVIKQDNGQYGIVNGGSDPWIFAYIDPDKFTPKLDDDGNPVKDENDRIIYEPVNTTDAISIYHNYHPVDDTTIIIDRATGKVGPEVEDFDESLLNTTNAHLPNNELNIYIPYVDAAGHVVGQHIENIVLNIPEQYNDNWFKIDENGTFVHVLPEHQSYVDVAGNADEFLEENGLLYLVKDFDQTAGHVTSVIAIDKDSAIGGLKWKGFKE